LAYQNLLSALSRFWYALKFWPRLQQDATDKAVQGANITRNDGVLPLKVQSESDFGLKLIAEGMQPIAE
jgi:hypothetical protein